MDIVGYEEKRQCCLIRHGGELTQDVVATLLSTMRNAAIAGARFACLQRLELGKQYIYSRVEGSERTTYAIHDGWTMERVVSTKSRVLPVARVRDLFDWICARGLRVMCTAYVRDDLSDEGEVIFEPFVNVYGIFVPHSAPGSVVATYYEHRIQGAAEWQERIVASIRAGNAHCCMCILHLHKDFVEEGEGKVVARNYLTLQLIPNRHFTLLPHLNELTDWCAQHGRRWILALHDEWAYFLVIRYFS